MQPIPLELHCDTCRVCLHADTEVELVELATRHALSIHGHAPTRDHVLIQIRHQNS